MSQMHTERPLAFDLIDRLHKSLRLSGMKAVEMAPALGVHRNTVNSYLSGKTAIDRRTLIAWAHVTDVPLVWLEHGIVVEDPEPGEPIDREQARDAVALLADRKRRATRAVNTPRYLLDHAAA